MITLWVALFALIAQGQMVDPVHFTSKLKMLKDGEAEIVFSATIDNGWHVYSTDMGNDGPISATFNVVKLEGAEKVGKLKPRGNVIKQYDKMFGMELRFFEKKAEFVQRIRFTKAKYTIDCYLEFGACNDEMCLPPTEVAFKKEGDASSNLPLKGEAKDATEEAPSNLPPLEEAKDSLEKDTSMVQQTDTVGSAAVDAWWAPVDDIQNNDGNDLSNRSLLYILLMGFVGGLLAVMMPCIWPIIPMTVSFFLKRAKTDRKKGLRDALTYGLSIVVI